MSYSNPLEDAMAGMQPETAVSWRTVEERALEALKPHLAGRLHAIPLKVYAIPRGGSCALLHMLDPEFGLPIVPVAYENEADVIFDDVVDSGATRALFSHRPDTPFLALFDKTGADKDIGWLAFPWEPAEDAESHVSRLIQFIGEDVAREGLKDTPRRVCSALREMTAGYALDPAAILSTAFAEAYDEMVVVRDIHFWSLCEHHMLPFSGTAAVGYIPDKKVVGLSKVARLVHCFARRLQIQERLTQEIANAMEEHLGATGVGVVIRANHTCMAMRGIRTPAEMVTSALLGAMREPEIRAEFLALAQ